MQMSAQNQTSCGSLDLLPRVSTGDPEAVAQCIERYGGLVWSLARRWFPVYADAEDAVQEAFIEIWQNAHRYDPAQGSEQLFVVLLTRRRLIDRLRKQGRRPINVPLDESGLTEALGDEGELVEQSVDAHFAAAALARLNGPQRRVIYLGVVEGLSHREIAQCLQLPLGTVKTHLRRGLLQIRNLLCNATQRRS